MAINWNFRNAREQKKIQTGHGLITIRNWKRKQEDGGFVVKHKETIPVARIKIEKIVEWRPYRAGEEKKDLRFIATITGSGRWAKITFNEQTKQKFWAHLKKEVFL
jgi:hypothetical protein